MIKITAEIRAFIDKAATSVGLAGRVHRPGRRPHPL